MGSKRTRAAAVLSAGALALALTACGDDDKSDGNGGGGSASSGGGSKSAELTKFEAHQKDTLEAEGATVEQVDCDSSATFKKGSKFDCKVTWSDAEYNETLSVTILDDKGKKMDYTSDSEFGGGGNDVPTGL